MIVDCIADLHGYEPDLPGGDLLILAGDYTATGKLTEWGSFFRWLKKQPYEKKIMIAGNHDNLFESGFPKNQSEADKLKEIIDFLDTDVDFEYLCDSGTKVSEYPSLKESGMVYERKEIKIWGTPWTPWFHGVNPKCRAFMDIETHLEKQFSLIPNDIDILITHGPMLHVLDCNTDGYACGSSALRNAIDRAKPRFHVFGHIHEQGNNQLMYNHMGPSTWCVNCSYVNEHYKPAFNHVRLEI